MCGIAGFYLLQPNNGINLDKLLDALLDGIDNRGGDATGYAAVTHDGAIQHQVASCRAAAFQVGRNPLPDDTRTVIAHTRWATQGDSAFPENNHPVLCENVYVTHNGHICNDWELWGEIGPGVRKGDVDSAVIPAVIAAAGWESALDGLSRLEGGMACAAIHADFPGELLLAKGETSPLIVMWNKKIVVWASTVFALEAAWRKAIGTVPKRPARELKWGDAILVKDGEMFEKTWTPLVTLKKYGNYATHWMADDYGYVNYTTTKAKPVDRTFAKMSDAILWAEFKDSTTEQIDDEITRLRDEANQIIADSPHGQSGWWDKEENVASFTAMFDRVAALKRLLEDRKWEDFEDDLSSKDTPEAQCASCSLMFDADEMIRDVEYDVLFCGECADYWRDDMELNKISQQRKGLV